MATLKHLAIKALTTDEVAQTSISQSLSAYEGITYVAKQLSSIIAKSQSSPDRIGINDVSLGTAVGNIRAVIFEMYYVTDSKGYDGRKSLDNCAAFPDLCRKYYNALHSSNFTQSIANTTMWSSAGQWLGLWSNFSRIFSNDLSANNMHLVSDVLLFDTRNNSCTHAFAANAVATLLTSLLPAAAPFFNNYILYILIENQWSDPRYGKATTEGAYVLMSISTQNNDLYYLDDQAFPFPFQWVVTTLEYTNVAQFYDSIRALVDIVIVLLFLGLIMQWCRELSLHRWQLQSKDGIMPWWKWLDILLLSGCLIFYLSKLYNLGIVSGNIYMSRKPLRTAFDLFYGTPPGDFSSNVLIAVFIMLTISYPTLKLFGCFRYHSELRVYMRFMHYFMHHVEGFLWAFLLVIMLAATWEFGFSIASGNSSTVHNFSSAFNAMMLLTFAQMDFDSIVNEGLGLPWGLQWLAFLLYWVFTISLTLLAQNLVLAIIGNAHDCSRRRMDPHREGTTVIGYMFKLLRFQLVYMIVWQGYVLYSIFSMLRGCGSVVRPSLCVLTATWMCRYLEPQVTQRGYFRLEYMWATMLKHDDTITPLGAMYLCVTSEIPSILLHGKINLPNGMTVRINIQAIQHLPYIDDVVKAQLTQAIIVAGTNEGTLHIIDQHRVCVEFPIPLMNALDMNANDDDDVDDAIDTPTPHKFEFYMESDYPAYLRKIAATSQTDVGLRIGRSMEYHSTSAKNVNERTDGMLAGGVGEGVFVGHVSEHVFDVICLKRGEKEFLTILEYVSEGKSLMQHSGILKVLSDMWRRKSTPHVPKVNKDTEDMTNVAHELFLAFQGSPIQRDRTVETRLQQQTEKNVFDMVDEHVDATYNQDVDSTFMGGYRNSVVINKLQEMNKKLQQSSDENKKMLDENKKMMYEMEQRIVKLLLAKGQES